jgi:hypothetical protein
MYRGSASTDRSRSPSRDGAAKRHFLDGPGWVLSGEKASLLRAVALRWVRFFPRHPPLYVCPQKCRYFHPFHAARFQFRSSLSIGELHRSLYSSPRFRGSPALRSPRPRLGAGSDLLRSPHPAAFDSLAGQRYSKTMDQDELITDATKIIVEKANPSESSSSAAGLAAKQR